MTQCYEDKIRLQEETNKLIGQDIQILSQSCPCGPNGTCLNIGWTIPIIENKHNLSNVNNLVTKMKLLLDDIKMRELRKSYYIGDIFYFQGEACGFFLINSQNVILRFVGIGEYSYTDMFCEFLKHHHECYIYTDVNHDVVKKAFGLNVKEWSDLSILNVIDHCPNKKLYRLV